MVGFNSIQVGDKKEVKKLNLSEALNIKEVVNKRQGLTKKELSKIEPGHKVYTSKYHQVAQWCEVCEDVKTFARDSERKIMICLECKNIRKHK